MKKDQLINQGNGFALLEITIGFGILAFLLTVVSGELFMGRSTLIQSGNLNRALFLTNEGLEGVRNIRDHRFSGLADGVFDLVTAGGAWSLQPFVANIIEDNQQRKITITTTGSGDNLRKEVRSEIIQWQGGQAVTLVNLVTRFANWTPTKVDWSRPAKSGSFDFTSANSGSNSHDARAVRVSGNYLYVGNKNSNAKEFIVLSIVNSPNLSILGALDLDGDPQKMDVFGNYLYIASGANAQELQIVDVSNKSLPLLAGSFNLTNANSGNDNNNANAIAVTNNYVILGRDIDTDYNFFIFDAGNNAGCTNANPCLKSKIQIKIGDVGYAPRDIKISNDGHYAYVIARSGNFFRVNISDKNNPVIDAAAIGTHGGDLFYLTITDTRAYIGTPGVTGSGPGKDEVYIIDIANASTASPSLVNSFNLGDNGVDVNGINFTADEKALIVLTTDTGKDFQVVNVGNELSLSLIGSLNLLDTVQAADWSDTYHSEYVVGQVSNAEIQIVVPSFIL